MAASGNMSAAIATGFAREKNLAEVDNPNARKGKGRARRKSSAGQRPKKLGYMEQRELQQLPMNIEQLEATVSELENQISAPDFYSQDHAEVQNVLEQLTENQQALDNAIDRWAELEERSQSAR